MGSGVVILGSGVSLVLGGWGLIVLGGKFFPFWGNSWRVFGVCMWFVDWLSNFGEWNYFMGRGEPLFRVDLGEINLNRI